MAGRSPRRTASTSDASSAKPVWAERSPSSSRPAFWLDPLMVNGLDITWASVTLLSTRALAKKVALSIDVDPRSGQWGRSRARLRADMALVVLLCFFLSGASGLVFEEVWTRELTLVFGS